MKEDIYVVTKEQVEKFYDAYPRLLEDFEDLHYPTPSEHGLKFYRWLEDIAEVNEDTDVIGFYSLADLFAREVAQRETA